MAGTSRLRHRQPSAEPTNLEYDQVQDDEHVGDVFQNPVCNFTPFAYRGGLNILAEKPEPL